MDPAKPAWTFVCILPMLLLAVSAVILVVVLVGRTLARTLKADVSQTLKRVLVLGVPLVLFALGAFGTAILSEDRGAPPLLVPTPLLLASALAVVVAVVLGRWAFPEWWASWKRPTRRDLGFVDQPGTIPFATRRFVTISAAAVVALFGGWVWVTFFNSGGGAERSLLLLLTPVFLLVVGGLFALLSLWAFPHWWSPRIRKMAGERLIPLARPLPPASRPESSAVPRSARIAISTVIIGLGVACLVYSITFHPFLSWVIGVVFAFATLAAHVRAAKRTPADTPYTQIGIVDAMFTRTGGASIVGGLLIGGMLTLFLHSFLIGLLVGGIFTICILAMHASQLKAMAKLTANTGRVDQVAPLLLTPDPSAVRGDCPTCGHAIPSDSPHGLCPRCLIRGAMPSPSSTRLRRGVSPIEPPTPAEVNEFFPHLEVLELVGAGGMGAVYKARQPTLDRIVAVKIVQSPRGDEDPVFGERFAREARAMAKLDHPNIVTIHESGEAGGLPFLVMEYIDGVTLREAMVNRLLTTVEALAVIPQVCDALDYAHRAGVVHRDIKPENILIDQTGRVKIADFGLAKLADPKNVTLTRTQQAMGTPHYMAPEQWERPNEVDHRADVYALGVVLYELLTGELPLGRFALPSEKGKGDVKLDQVVIRALAKDPGERFQNAGQMKAALSGVKLTAFNPVAVPKKRKGFEYRSKTSFLGLPLVHVVAGWDPVTGKKRIAKGWFAAGDVMAVGGIALGGVTGAGIVGVGGVAGCGLVGVGGAVAIGALAIGGNAAGLLFALGGNAASTGLSIGGLAAGKFAIGGEATGEYVISDKTNTHGFGDALLAWVRGFWPF